MAAGEKLELTREWVHYVNRHCRQIASMNGPLVRRNGEQITIGGISSSRFIPPGGGSAELPTPQYQYMVYQGVRDNVAGFDDIRAGPMRSPTS